MPTVTKYPQTVTNAGSSTWNNQDNIKTDDTNYADTEGSRNANWDIIASNFGFDIPAGSIINSVSCETVYKLSTTASAWTGTFQMQYNGSIKGSAATTTSEPITDTTWTKTTNNGTWTVDELNNALAQVLFRVRRTSNTACTYYVEYISMTVDYQAPDIRIGANDITAAYIGTNVVSAIYLGTNKMFGT